MLLYGACCCPLEAADLCWLLLTGGGARVMACAPGRSRWIGHFSQGVGFKVTYMPDLPSRGGGGSTLAH
eukprot:COSAG02_NODE_67092_length_254_cov_0.238710_1_plen_68_part_10